MNTWNHTIYFAQLLTQLLTCFFLSTTKKRGISGIPGTPRKASVSNCSFGTPDGVTRAGAPMEA